MSFDIPKIKSVHHSRLTIIKSLLQGYDGKGPFHLYLKACFVKNKNFGSRDRKIYSAWCYAFFRLGNALAEEEFEMRLAVAWYLVHGPGDELFNALNLGKISEELLPLAERISHIQKLFPAFALSDIFPFTTALSSNMTAGDYAVSMLVQPRVWIRIVKGTTAEVKADLEANGISFENDIEIENACSFDSGVKLDQLATKQKNYFEIQDRSSQLAGAVIPAAAGEHWWDCCCGAGGKSLELLDNVPKLKITATDSRATILKNFRERTEKYHSQISTTVLDLEQPVSPGFFGSKFDGIVADVPCSGSGTWSRNPEHLSLFTESTLVDYTSRQKAIILGTLPFLKEGGTLVYITCSVFKVENEDVVAWISALPGIKLQSAQFINGSNKKADSMFYAIFAKQ